jgi:hypothetical protein
MWSGEIVIRSNGDYMSYNIADKIKTQFSDDKCYMAKVRNEHGFVALKRLRSNVTRPRDPNEDLYDNKSLG